MSIFGPVRQGASRSKTRSASTAQPVSAGRRRAARVTAVLGTAGVLAFGVAPAWAGGRSFEKSFGGPCEGVGGACEPGQLKDPSGVAVNEETGDVYVVDQGSGKVEELSATGSALLAEFNGAAAPTGPLSAPEGIAVDNSDNPSDPSDHDVYVADTGHNVVDKFSATGVYLGQLPVVFEQAPEGVAVDSGGGVWVYVRNYDGRAEVMKFSDLSGNELLSRFEHAGIGSGPGFAVSPDGSSVYIHGNGHNVAGDGFAKLDAAGTLLIENISPPEATAAATDLAGDLYVDEGTSIVEFNEAPSCVALAPCNGMPSGSLIETFGEGHLTAGQGIAVDSATGFAYVADAGASMVAVFSAPPPPPTPAAAADAATNLQVKGGATLNGTVNPKGVTVTSCEFEYATAEELGSTGTYDHSVPCSSPGEVSEANPLTGEAPIAVSATIEGAPLRPGEVVVSYRLKAGYAGGVVHSAADTYVTGPTPAPVVGVLPATLVSQFSATLNGTLETPETLAGYHFEYGTTTAYGSVAPIPDGETPLTLETVFISQPVSGLKAGTTYHYRIVASSPGGTDVKGPDETFTTLPVPPPTASTGASSGIGVGSATLNGTVDPHGWDTTYLFEYGTSAAYGSSWPTVQVDMGALEGPQPVVVGIPNLLPSTTYHYRLVASNGGGSSYGQDMTFTTGEYPAQVIQEPPALGTLLVPSELGKVSTSEPKKKKSKKKAKKRKGRHKKQKRYKKKKR